MGSVPDVGRDVGDVIGRRETGDDPGSPDVDDKPLFFLARYHRQLFAITREREIADKSLSLAQSATLAGGEVVQFHHVSGPGRCERIALRGEGDTRGPGPVRLFLEHVRQLATRHVPQLHASVTETNGQATAIGGETYRECVALAPR